MLQLRPLLRSGRLRGRSARQGKRPARILLQKREAVASQSSAMQQSFLSRWWRTAQDADGAAVLLRMPDIPSFRSFGNIPHCAVRARSVGCRNDHCTGDLHSATLQLNAVMLVGKHDVTQPAYCVPTLVLVKSWHSTALLIPLP